ncbi:hypothetical protein V8F20_010589 [Naviculisporaceae sp. PSN 640]
MNPAGKTKIEASTKESTVWPVKFQRVQYEPLSGRLSGCSRLNEQKGAEEEDNPKEVASVANPGLAPGEVTALVVGRGAHPQGHRQSWGGSPGTGSRTISPCCIFECWLLTGDIKTHGLDPICTAMVGRDFINNGSRQFYKKISSGIMSTHDIEHRATTWRVKGDGRGLGATAYGNDLGRARQTHKSAMSRVNMRFIYPHFTRKFASLQMEAESEKRRSPQHARH